MFKTAMVVAALGVAAPLGAQSLSAEHQRLDFLAGRWNTVSTYPDGRSIPGQLEYRWVLGGGWMRIEFIGERPGSVWEAHGFMKYDSTTAAYRSWVVFSGGDPVEYVGQVDSAGVFHVQTELPNGRAGIDYHPRGNGVYQENWSVGADGERRVTLRTVYTRSD